MTVFAEREKYAISSPDGDEILTIVLAVCSQSMFYRIILFLVSHEREKSWPRSTSIEKQLHLGPLNINFDCVLGTDNCRCFERSIPRQFYHRHTSCIHTCPCCQYKSQDHCRNSMNKWQDAGSIDSKTGGKWRYQRNIDRELGSIDPVHRRVSLCHRDRNGIHSRDNRRLNDQWLCWSLLEIQIQRYDSEVVH